MFNSTQAFIITALLLIVTAYNLGPVIQVYSPLLSILFCMLMGFFGGPVVNKLLQKKP